MRNVDKAETFEVLFELSNQLNSSLDLEQVLNFAMDRVIDLMSAERGFIMLKNGRELECHVSHGIPRESVRGGIDYSRSIIDIVLQNERAIRLKDALTDEKISPKTSIKLMGVRSVMCVPLKAKERVIGLIYLDTTKDQAAFEEHDLDVLVALANNAAIAIENARLYKDLKETTDRRLELERKVAEQDKKAAVLEASQAMREELAHYLVHDMRSPLSVVVGNLEYIKPSVEQVLNEEGKEAFEDTEKAMAKLTRLVNGILDVYRLESGKVKLNKAEFDLAAVIDDLVRSNRRIVAAGVSLVSDVHGAPITVNADKDMIQRVLGNLVSNAANFTTRGAITVMAKKMDQGAFVAVKDTGPGIPAEHHEKIFERFGRVEATGAPRGLKSAFGMGLRFCQLAVSAHKGKIWVESREGEGTTFFVLLP